jgi:hypothetical protein
MGLHLHFPIRLDEFLIKHRNKVASTSNTDDYYCCRIGCVFFVTTVSFYVSY